MLPSVLAAAAAPGTRSSSCDEAIATLFGLGGAFLWAALVFAVIAALTALYLSLRTPPAAPEIGPQGLPTPAPLVEALLKLIEGLAKAPVWLAMFACGALLFWMGASLSDGACGNTAKAAAAQGSAADGQQGKPSPAPTSTGAPK